ncbi:alpha/beta hydrolase [Novosphingobium cyanobacteriorum]|uniref:Alpha/beta hydrolase n=1 Tax=Novosphingobium cyanobacteriorum TaxID=3024215 RepID=A0ABT6CDK6_9SPHN|nr:alpha/beta hydrolase [Novosphingobium cyanobacteriorum]MDF8332008.1 alpha/beta hydrolase [Novosphingobium cyanobacteriorum]
MTKSILLSALASSALLALSPALALAQTLEPSAAGFAKAAAAGKPIYERSYIDARAVLAGVQQDKVAASAPTTTQDLVWKIGPTGAVRIRIVRPADAQGNLPAVLYYHGGGWVMGDRHTHDHLIRELAVQTRAAVVFVEYDNAPEVRYPVNNEQAYAALEYVATHGSPLGIDGTRLAVAGDSAGGNMAIAVTMMAKDRAGPRISHQLLFYPVTDDVSDDASYREFGNGPFLTRKAMDYFLEANYPAENRKDVLAFPLRATTSQLSGLPEATIIVAENDLLRDEGEAYGRRLIDAGVPVATTRFGGTIHDFVMLNPLARSEPARAAISLGAARLRGAFGN